MDIFKFQENWSENAEGHEWPRESLWISKVARVPLSYIRGASLHNTSPESSMHIPHAVHLRQSIEGMILPMAQKPSGVGQALREVE